MAATGLPRLRSCLVRMSSRSTSRRYSMTNAVAPDRLKALYVVGTRWVSDSELGADVKAYIDSLNLHRRHLNSAVYQQLIAASLKADPGQSNRAVAKQVGSSPT